MCGFQTKRPGPEHTYQAANTRNSESKEMSTKQRCQNEVPARFWRCQTDIIWIWDKPKREASQQEPHMTRTLNCGALVWTASETSLSTNRTSWSKRTRSSSKGSGRGQFNNLRSWGPDNINNLPLILYGKPNLSIKHTVALKYRKYWIYKPWFEEYWK